VDLCAPSAALGDNKPKDWSIADNNQPSQEKTSLKTGGEKGALSWQN
jgi:hypothetical protein